MASGCRGQVSHEKVHHCDCSIHDVMIEDLQRQVVALTQRLVAQNISNREMEDHNSYLSFENLYQNHAMF